MIYVAYSPEKTIFQCLGRKLIIDWVNWPGSGATVRLSGPGASQGSLPVLCSQTLETGPGAGSDSSHPVSLVSPGLSCLCIAPVWPLTRHRGAGAGAGGTH